MDSSRNFAFVSPTVFSICKKAANSPTRQSRVRAPRAMAATAPIPQTSLLRNILPPRAAQVKKMDGSTVDLVEDVLQNAPDVVLLGWLRHFGCVLCRRQAVEWDQTMRRMLEDGVCEHTSGKFRIAFVGSGTVQQAIQFAQETELKGTLYTDPHLDTYVGLGFARGMKSVFNLPALQRVIASFWSGYKQRWSMRATDPLLQGGALVIDKSGAVVHLHRDRFAGDHAPLETLVEAAEHVCQACL